MECQTCRGLRHVPRDGGFSRCPECYVPAMVDRELRSRDYPLVWKGLSPSLVIPLFQDTPEVAAAMRDLAAGVPRRIHAYSLPNEHRQAFTGSLVYGFLACGVGAQVLDSADLSLRHFTKDSQKWGQIEKSKEAVIFTLGREIEPRIGFFYFRALLDRAVNYALPFVLITDYPLSVHDPRYPDLMAVVNAARFDRTDLQLTP